MAEFNEEEYEGGALTDEEKLGIVRHFLLSAPPCQFEEVLADVKALVPESLLTHEFLDKTARLHNLKYGCVVLSPKKAKPGKSEKKSLLCEAGEIDENHYLDSKSGIVFAANHISKKIAASDIDSPENPASIVPQKKAIESKLEEYVSQRYIAPDSAGAVYFKSGNELTICIVGEKANLRNFWSGKWSSTWSVVLDTDNGACTIEGRVAIKVHYFEDGNVQMTSKRKFDGKHITISQDTDLGVEILKHIEDCESSIQSGLHDMYNNMNDVTFKAMRRTLPVTRTKMDWNVNAHKMAKAVSKTER